MVNHIDLAGTICSEVEDIQGADSMTSRFRIKVPRAEKGSDTFNCVVENQQILKRLSRLQLNEKIIVSGELRSRFFKVGTRVAAVTEVLVLTLRKK